MFFEQPSQHHRSRRASPFVIAPDDAPRVVPAPVYQNGHDEDEEWQVLHQEINSIETYFQIKKQEVFNALSMLAEDASLATQKQADADAMDIPSDNASRDVKIIPQISSPELKERRRLLQLELESNARALMDGVSQLHLLGEATLSLLQQLRSLDTADGLV